jgi:glycerol-3-phosphate acyltransferase PlsX
MIVALDAMGGDHAPGVTIEGAIMATAAHQELSVVLVGDSEAIEQGLKGKSFASDRIRILHASEVVGMEDSPVSAIRRKKDSSLRRCIELVRDKTADAAVSAGNSGAMMALAFFTLGVSKGVERPAIATMMPSVELPFLLLDAGANADCNPENLLHFALMGNAYTRHVLKRPSPRIGLLSNGEEPTKGNELTKEAFKLLQSSGLNFIGNIESKDVFMGAADVVVCDGFTGNIFLKTSEGIADVIMKLLRQEIERSKLAILGALLMKKAVKNLKKRTDYDEYGGAPLLGIDGTCFISHGRSTPKAIMNALLKASDFSEKRIFEIISRDIRKIHPEENTVAAG